MVGLLGTYSNQPDLLARLERLLAMVPDWPEEQPGQPEAGRRRRARPLRPAEIDELVAGYQLGETVYELADRFGIHRLTVGKHLAARGVDTSRHSLDPAELSAAVTLYEQGWTLARLAEHYGTAKETVRKNLLKAGVRMRKRHERSP